MSNQLYFISKAFDVRIHCFVLMSNHFHLIVHVPLLNLSEAMGYFLRETSRELVKQSDRINMTYGGRFFRSVLGSHHYFLTCYKYVYLNPVRSGLVDRAEDYPWSTLPGLLGLQPLFIPMVHDDTLFGDVEGTLAWLNRSVKDADWNFVRKALRKKEFRIAEDPITRKAHRLGVNLI